MNRQTKNAQTGARGADPGKQTRRQAKLLRTRRTPTRTDLTRVIGSDVSHSTKPHAGSAMGDPSSGDVSATVPENRQYPERTTGRFPAVVSA